MLCCFSRKTTRSKSLVFAILAAALLGGFAPIAASAQEPSSDGQPASEQPAEPVARTDAAAPPTFEERNEDYELLRLLIDTLDQVERNYVKEVNRRELVEAAIAGMVGKLDEYSSYIPPKDVQGFRDGVESEYGGIGIKVSQRGEKLYIISPIVGSPAYRGGVLAGDVITKIGDESADGMTVDDAIKRLKGPVGQEVTFTVKHAHDDSEETVTLKREIVRVDTVMGYQRSDDDSWSYWIDAEQKIAYVRLTAFGSHTADELRDALKGLEDQEMQALVLDLRFNPGGLLSAAIEVCDMFIAEGRIVSTAGRNVEERVWNAHRRGTFAGFPMAVLVNRYSASASEIVSACLQDHGRAIVVGHRTWGKGSVQNIVNLEDGGSALKLTTASYRGPSGRNIHRFPDAKDADEWGVSPNDGFAVSLSPVEMGELIEDQRVRDIVAKPEEGGETSADDKPAELKLDKQLKKAVEYLREKLDPTVTEEQEENVLADKPDAKEEAKAAENSDEEKTANDEGPMKRE